MNLPAIGVLVLYFLCMGLLAVYGFHRLGLVLLCRRHRRRPFPAAPGPLELPTLTVQLPLYNEIFVAERLLDAVCALDYPKDRLEIQVLDDSTDGTADLCRRKVEEHAARGLRIRHLRRSSRDGYKAGALAAGLREATGDLIAIFDADFVPPADFARRAVAHFEDPAVGMVQARWGHLNRDYSTLTRVQSILLDGHFLVEQSARNRSGRFFNFNGTAGIWRRSCIEAAGGWQHDTLTEDLDLSYRAQLLGWRFVFLPDLVAPAELPVQIGAFMSQQHRWAKGSIQTALKVLPRILRSPLPGRVKSEAVFHLTANFAYVLMTIVSILFFPAMLARQGMRWNSLLGLDFPIFLLATGSVVAFYLFSQRQVRPERRGSLRDLPVLMAVGAGLCLNNTRAVLEALAGRRTGFVRTPKLRAEGKALRGDTLTYPGRLSALIALELALGLYFTGVLVYAITHRIYASLPFVLLFQAGYLYTSILALIQAARRVP
ncbi:MAG TPA: cellulose synthase family protein [Candidatus Polarisedimenticolia bacterium]|jgi:cellulose synthase/poly-beta-1,6-N-acetylglucosamine synthase-like glycosyltransferase|nr:cellulose synthase family protein [Candidatus Polarisedimenticolia bacterium]